MSEAGASGYEQPNVVILASGDIESGGGGSTANKVIRDSVNPDQDIAFNVVGVICNNPPGSVGVYNHVEAINREHALDEDDAIKVSHISQYTHPEGKIGRGLTETESTAICEQLEAWDADFVLMLGYLRIVRGPLMYEWGYDSRFAADPYFGHHQGIYHPLARIGNNHPSILPYTADTYGHFAHEKVAKLQVAGVLSHTAMTWQLAARKVDGGPVIAERAVPIPPSSNEAKTAELVSDYVQLVEKQDSAMEWDNHLRLRAQNLAMNGLNLEMVRRRDLSAIRPVATNAKP